MDNLELQHEQKMLMKAMVKRFNNRDDVQHATIEDGVLVVKLRAPIEEIRLDFTITNTENI